MGSLQVHTRYLTFSLKKLIYLYIIYFQIFQNIRVILNIQWIFAILLSLFVIRNFRCTCSSIKMLKGYMVTERLGTPVLDCARTGVGN